MALPNILVTGTPGVGKTSFAAELATRLGLTHLNVGTLAEEHDCFDGYDDERDCKVLDDDKVVRKEEGKKKQDGEGGERRRTRRRRR